MSNLTRQVLRTLISIALFCGLIYIVFLVRNILLYIVLAAVIALVGKPMMRFFTEGKYQKLRLNRTLAAALTLLSIVSVFTLMLSIFIPALISELAILSDLEISALTEELKSTLFSSKFTGKNLASEKLEEFDVKEALSAFLSLDNITNTFAGLVSSLGNLVFALFSILFISFFFLREKNLFKNIVLALAPDGYEEHIENISPNLRNNLSRYFSGLLLQITIITTVVSVGLSLIGFNNTVVIGFFAGLINVIPYLGPIMGMGFGLVVGLAQNLTGWFHMETAPLVLAIISVFALVQLVDNFILQPVIFSNSINAHPLEIFLVICFAASIGGIPAMIVAVPGYSVLRTVAFEFFPNHKLVRWLAIGRNHGSEDEL